MALNISTRGLQQIDYNAASTTTNAAGMDVGGLRLDSTTNEVSIYDGNQWNTITGGTTADTLVINDDGTRNFTYIADYTTTFTNNGTGFISMDSSRYHLFHNDELEIDSDGNILVAGKQESNPSKIGLALLRAVEQLRKDRHVATVDDLYE